MHYYYGKCEECQKGTYRWPTEDFYRHLSDGRRECALKCAGCEDPENAPHSIDCDEYWPEPVSGDYCLFGMDPDPAYFITHYRCDDYADGTVVDVRNGKVIVPAKPSALRGFHRD